MRKDELVRALVRAAKRESAKRTSSKATARGMKKRIAPVRKAAKVSRSTQALPRTPSKRVSPSVVRKIQQDTARREQHKNLAPLNGIKSSSRNGEKDRIVLLVRDAYWLQALWELTRHNVERAQAAMAEQWHTAKPVLRLIQIDAGNTTSTSERVVREIGIHGGVRTWYIDVNDSPRGYRVDIGYLAASGKFFTLARSNAVTTPRPGSSEATGNDWSDIADNCEKIYALSGGYSDDGNSELQEVFEERLGRRMGSPAGTRFGTGADKSLGKHDFEFDVDAEMIIYGATKPNSHVTLAGTPVKLRADGSFAARLSMPDRRQVLPVVASSPDGVEQRTVVLAVERNTKVMEPMIKDSAE